MGSPKWTKEQQEVIDSRDCNLLVAAAAGSGKTAVLVERIIKIITNKEKLVDIDSLLVVTFTNAAASEMRERIGDAIGKALEENPEDTHLQNQLVLLNKASITTIHSFCLEVIKSNFHKIDLDPNFRIGDETECTILKLETIEEVFEEFYEAKEDDFYKLVESYSEKRGDSNLQHMVLSIYSFVMSSPYPRKWLKDSINDFNIDDNFDFSTSKWAHIILDTVKIQINGIVKNFNKALEMVEGIEELETFTDKLKIEYKMIKNLLDSCDKGWEESYRAALSLEFENYAKGVKRIPKGSEEYIKEAKNKAKKIRDDAKKSLESIQNSTFNKDISALNKEIKMLYPVVNALGKVLIRFMDLYSNRKREKGIIDFNDIEHFALDILIKKDENEDIVRDKDGKAIGSDVALEYREKFYEIFIDEYQDSNFVQEVLLSTIAKVETPNRFMVGDVKQSIYRFRQAKPEIFLEKYATYGTEKGEANRKIMLYKNFRSREEVVNCANYIFENTMSKQIGDIDYTEDERLNLGAVFKENENENAIVGGPSEIHIIQTKANINDSKDDNDKELSDEEEEEIDNIQIEARMVGKIIQEMMNPKSDGKIQMVYDKKLDDYRPVEFKDIVILLRATSAWAPVFADELMNMDIPTYADIGVGYFETIEIKTIMSLLQVIDNPMQDIPLLAVLKSPICGFTPEELIDIRVEDNQRTFYEALEKYSNQEDEIGHKCLDFLNKLQDYKEKSLYMSTDEFLWYLYTRTGYFAYVGALPGGSQRQANLKILFERAKQFEETSFKGIFNFINFISKLKKSNTDMGSAKTLGENANVVRIMSIHKSKGLEFPVVICSGMGKNFNNQDFRKSILYHHDLGYGPELVDYKRRISYPSIAKEALKSRINIENLSEEMRVLYVAFTRPKEKLIITGSSRDINKSITSWSNGIGLNQPISKYKILKGRSFLDWIMPSVLKHKDLENIREMAEVELDYIDNHPSKWEAKIWYKEDVILETKEDEEDKCVRDTLENLDIDKPSTSYYDKIKEKLDYKYKYEVSTEKPASISVTEIKKIQNSYEEEFTQDIFNTKINLKKPLFMQEKTEDKITGAEKGNLVHLIMELLDFNKINTIDEIKDQINTFIKKNIITEKQSTAINPYKIYKFFKSNIGQRMLKSPFLKKEQPIYSQIKIKDVYIYEDLIKDEDLNLYDDETIMLRGIIDAYFEEDEKIVIVDYKTDFVNDENKEEVINRYKKQLDLYAEVVENLTGKEVKEKCIYLFSIDEEVSI